MGRDSLKNSIRTNLPKYNKAKKVTKWDSDTQPNIYSLDIFLRKSGYRLIDVVDNNSHPELIIEPINSDHLHPDISQDVSDDTFYIHIKKYGELNASDVEELIKGYQTAIAVVQHLEEIDLSILEYEE